MNEIRKGLALVSIVLARLDDGSVDLAIVGGFDAFRGEYEKLASTISPYEYARKLVIEAAGNMAAADRPDVVN